MNGILALLTAVGAAAAPATGDESYGLLLLSMLLVAGVGLLATFPPGRHRKN